MSNISTFINIKQEFQANSSDRENSNQTSFSNWNYVSENKKSNDLYAIRDEASVETPSELCPYKIWFINIYGQPEQAFSVKLPFIEKLKVDFVNDKYVLNKQIWTVKPEVQGNENLNFEFTDQASIVKDEDKPKKECSQRIDVALKKVLRGFRRYYIDSFHELTNYRSLKKSNQTNELYISCLKMFVNSKFSIKEDNELVDLLRRLIATNRNMPKDKLFEVLFKFNFKKFKILLENSQVRFLLNHYINLKDGQPKSKTENQGIKMIINEWSAY